MKLGSRAYQVIWYGQNSFVRGETCTNVSYMYQLQTQTKSGPKIVAESTMWTAVVHRGLTRARTPQTGKPMPNTFLTLGVLFNRAQFIFLTTHPHPELK